MGARSGNDLVWSKVLLREFLGGSCHTEELHLDKCVAANFEFRSWKTAGVSRSLVSTLSISYMLPKLLMQLVKVCNEVPSTGGSEITFQVNCEVRVVALIGEKGHDSSSSTGCIIIGKLS